MPANPRTGHSAPSESRLSARESTAAPESAAAPATGLSAALKAALGVVPAKAHLRMTSEAFEPAVHAKAGKIRQASKPASPRNSTVGPRKGHK